MKNKTQQNPQKPLILQAECTKKAKAATQQVIKLRNMIQRQHNVFLSQTATHGLILERIINKLKLIPQIILVGDSKEFDWRSDIDFCIKEIIMMLEGHERARKGWQVVMKELQEQKTVYNQPGLQAQQYKEDLFAFQPVGFGEYMCRRMSSLQNLEEEIQKLDIQYEQILQQNKAIKQQYNNLAVLYSQSILKNQQFQSKLHQLSKQNTILTKQLKDTKNELRQYRQTAHRAFANELEFSKIIDENEREICKVHEQVQRLNQQIIFFQLKFKQIVEREGREKTVPDYKLKRQDSKILCEIPTQNTIDSIQSKTSKRQLQKMRKFNLQSVQQKLSAYKFLG